MFDWILGRALGVPDAINRRLHPFEEFTRPAHIIDKRPISVKAMLAWAKMERWRFGPMKEFYANVWPTDGGDHAFFQGQHTAAAVLLKDRAVVARSMQGQSKLQYLGGDSRMARGADSSKPGNHALKDVVPEGRMRVGDPNRTYYEDDEGYIFHQNCSESSLIGQNVGNFFAMLLGEKGPRKLAQISAVDLADQLIADDYRMMDSDGITPAKFGDLRPGWRAAPIRVGTLACTLLLAHEASGDEEYRNRYRDLVWRNIGVLTHQETHFLWVHPYYQDLLAYWNYLILCTLDRSGHQGKFLGALRHLWERTNQEGNSLYCYIAKLAGLDVGQDYIDQAEKTLNEFNLDPELGPTGKEPGSTANLDPFDHPSYVITPRPWGIKLLNGGKKLMSRQPLPPAFRPASDFFWQRDPYTIEGANTHHYNMLDLVLAAAMGRHLGLLKKEN